MSEHDPEKKFTKRLLNPMRRTDGVEPIEVIVRLEDQHALARLAAAQGRAIESIALAAEAHAGVLIKSVVEEIRRLGREDPRVRLLNQSWLTHSVLVSAPPNVVNFLARRDNVDLIDLNAECEGRIADSSMNLNKHK